MPVSPVILKDFSGLDLRSKPSMESASFSIAQNVDLNDDRVLVRRDGWRLLDPNEELGENIIVGPHKDHLIVAYWHLGSVRLWDYDSQTGVYTSIGNYPSPTRPHVGGVTYFNGFYHSVGQDVYLWDGAVDTLVASLGVDVHQFIVVNDRIFTFDVSDSNQILYSEITVSSWPVGNFIKVNPGDGDRITSIIYYRDLIFIFKVNSVWTLDVLGEPAEWVLRNLTQEYGCLGKNTAIEADGYLYFRSRNHIVRTDGVSFIPISLKLEDTLKWSMEFFALEFDYYGQEFLVRKGRQLIFITFSPSAGGGIEFVQGYCLNLQNLEWTSHRYQFEIYGLVGVAPNKMWEDLVGITDNGLFTSNSSEDLGVGFDTQIKFNSVDLGSPHTLKRLRRLFLTYKGGRDLKIGWYADGRAGDFRLKDYDGDNGWSYQNFITEPYMGAGLFRSGELDVQILSGQHFELGEVIFDVVPKRPLTANSKQ